MAKKILHAGSIGVAFVSVVQAADVTVTGGAGTAIAAALSALEIFTKSKPSLEQQLASGMTKYLSQSHLSAGRRIIALQMAARFPPKEIDIANGNKRAETIAENMRKNLEATSEQLDSAYQTKTALNDYEALLAASLTPCLEPMDQTSADMQVVLERTAALMAKVGASEEHKRLIKAGVTEDALIKMAQRISGETQDVGQAWIDLQNAMEIAERVQKDGHTASNDRFVDQVMQQVAEHSAQGDYTKAKAALAEAQAQDEAAFQARQIRFLGRRIDIALLEGASEEAAQLLVEKADVDAGGVAAFEDLRELFIQYYETGRDKGIALDLEVAIDLAQRILSRASTADQRGTAQNDLGTALRTLGERESDTARLEQAVAAYEAALQERTQERVPFNWAVTQHCLSGLELAFFDKEQDPARLDNAMAYANAARAVYMSGGATHYVEWIDGRIDEIKSRRAAL